MCVWITNVTAADKIVADYGGHAGFQSATWVAKDLRSSKSTDWMWKSS